MIGVEPVASSPVSDGADHDTSIVRAVSFTTALTDCGALGKRDGTVMATDDAGPERTGDCVLAVLTDGVTVITYEPGLALAIEYRSEVVDAEPVNRPDHATA